MAVFIGQQGMPGKISLTMINFIYRSVENEETINQKTDTKVQMKDTVCLATSSWAQMQS